MQISYGEVHKIVGGHPSLGGWNVDAAPAMQWSDGDVWSLDVSLPAGTGLEFKVVPRRVCCLTCSTVLKSSLSTAAALQCVKVSGGGVEWEGGGNRSVQVQYIGITLCRML